VRLPEVTIRERRQEPTRLVPVEPSSADKPAPRLVGCDPVASPLAGSSVQHLTGRCLVEAPPSWRAAALD
jgi:hypothetical protein